MSIKASKTDDKIYCKSVAKSISSIIRYSLDEEFRNSAFELFNVSSTKEVEKEINKRLTLIIESERTVPRNGENKPKKRRKNSLHEKGKENQQISKDAPDKNEPNSSFSKSKNESQMFFQNFFGHSEPQISFQQYRNVIKKKYIDCFSQPSSKSYKNDCELSMSNLKYSHSQPSTTPSHTEFYEATNSSSEMSHDGMIYCREMFRDSLKNNAQTYLKKNLKSYKHINF